MTEAQKKARTYAEQTPWHDRDRVEVSAISYHAGWVECEANVKALISALEFYAKECLGIRAKIRADQGQLAREVLRAYRSEKEEERMGKS